MPTSGRCRSSVDSAPKPVLRQCSTAATKDPRPAEQEQEAAADPSFEHDAVQEALEAGAARVHPQLPDVGAADERQPGRLAAEDERRGRDQHRLHVEGDPPDAVRSGDQHDHAEQPDRDQDERRVEQQPARAERQQEAQMPPAVPPGAQVRAPGAAVRAQRRRHLGRPTVRRARRAPPSRWRTPCRSSAGRGRGCARGRNPRMPQWKSWIGMRKNSRPR